MLIRMIIFLDHLVELQLLDSVAQRSGICGILTALVAADPTQNKAKLLDRVSADISALKNLNFLEDVVNNRVRWRTFAFSQFLLTCFHRKRSLFRGLSREPHRKVQTLTRPLEISCN